MKWINKLTNLIHNIVKSSNNVCDVVPSPMKEIDVSGRTDGKLLQESDGNDQEMSEVQSAKLSSLLGNTEYMALAQQCCDILGELDRMYNQVSDDQLKSFIIQQKSRIREALVLSGATLIDEVTEFNLLRHQSAKGGIVNNGTPISEVVEAGVEIDGRVMMKAKITLI